MAYQTHPSKSFFMPSLKVNGWLEEYATRDPQFSAQNNLLRKLDFVRVHTQVIQGQLKELPAPAPEVEGEVGVIREILDKIDDELHEYFSKQYLEIFHA